MNMLWTPEIDRPQVEPEVVDLFIGQLSTHGLAQVYEAWKLDFLQRQAYLKEIVENVGLDENGEPIINRHALGTLRVAAVVTDHAYVESGYDVTVDDEALRIADLDLEIEDPLQSYVISVAADAELQRLLGAVSETPEAHISNSVDVPVSSLLEIGAGCVRHYMKFAVAA